MKEGPLRLKDLLMEGVIRERLTAVGLSGEAARAKGELFSVGAKALLAKGRSEEAPVCALWVPGRIEVLGKHTDYAGGRSLLVAAERGLTFMALPRSDRVVGIFDPVRRKETHFEIDPALSPERGHWSNYPMTVARRLARNFSQTLRGADIVLASDLPRAAGMSSSSALIVGFALLLMTVNRLEEDPAYLESISDREALAGYLACIENGQSFGSLVGDHGVGTHGGSEDHTAILCCEPQRLSQYAFCPVRLERVIDSPPGFTFAVAVSGVKADKTGRARELYNRASRLAAEAALLWKRSGGYDDPHLGAAVARGPLVLQSIRTALSQASHSVFSPSELVDRFEQFYAENEEIIPPAGDALAQGDVAAFGKLTDRSQRLAEQLLGNQVEETVFLSQSARNLGAAAASSFGAGFGGSVWALVASDQATRLLTQWTHHYKEAYPKRARGATFFLTQAGPSSGVLSTL